MFLIGSSGTGKTISLVNALKTKVAYYKRQKKPVKILLCGYEKSKELERDLASEKYGLQTIIKEYQCKPVNLNSDPVKSLKGMFYLSLKT